MKKTKRAAKPATKSTKKMTSAMPASMPMKTKMPAAMPPTTPFNWLVIIFVSLFVVNSITIYVANMLFPNAVVLGTNVISPLMALVSGSALLSLILVAAMPIVEAFQKAQKFTLTSMHWMALYFVLNFVGLWFISRLAEQVGMGLSSWMVAAAVALILDVVQGLVITSLMKQMK